MQPIASIKLLLSSANMRLARQGFVSNKDAAQLADSDPVERLLYSALVAATSRSSVGHLASILNEDVDRLCQVRLSALSATSAGVFIRGTPGAAVVCVMPWVLHCHRPSPLPAAWASPTVWRPYTVRDLHSRLTV